MEIDEKEIIFLALSEYIINLNTLLEESKNKEEIDNINFLLGRCIHYLDKYTPDIEDKPISKPNF